ncbi:MAG: cation transporter [Actinobacteria bacterium]|nr:cation transporter [Actinomycetota bacterium]MBI3256745.1 cation transporter [Actinomycetota bacterium]
MDRVGRNVGWVLVAGTVGFVGNELVAIHRIRVGRRIRSAALVADGLHARTDGMTSLAVVLGALGVVAGWFLTDPIVGLATSFTPRPLTTSFRTPDPVIIAGAPAGHLANWILPAMVSAFGPRA